jgi:1,2-diacylglycerol 3-beta-glucosyltransferase
MSILYIVLLSYVLVYITFQSVLLIRFLFFTQPVLLFSKKEKPRISILIAARNEEQSILDCLKSIDQLNYSTNCIEVFIGDDQSTDATNAIVQDFIKNKPNFNLIRIETTVGKAKGKANVLAQLAHKATGEFLFITDADIQVPKYWIEGLLGSFTDDTGIVSGATVVRGKGVFAGIQQIDWAYAFGMVHIVSEMNMPVSAVGNNMAIRKTCYDETGGYENIAFSVTEDLELFISAIDKGWKFRNLLDTPSVAKSTALKTMAEALRQRKRWLSGALRLPILLLVFLGMQAIYFPVFFCAFILLPWTWVLFAWLVIWILQTLFISLIARKMVIPNFWNHLLAFELNRYVFPIVLFIYNLLPTGIVWKGRTYTGKEVQP